MLEKYIVAPGVKILDEIRFCHIIVYNVLRIRIPFRLQTN